MSLGVRAGFARKIKPTATNVLSLRPACADHSVSCSVIDNLVTPAPINDPLTGLHEDVVPVVLRMRSFAAQRLCGGRDRIRSHAHPVPWLAVSQGQALGSTAWQSSQLAQPSRWAASASCRLARWGRCWPSSEPCGSW
jgi:hypothetical protein